LLEGSNIRKDSNIGKYENLKEIFLKQSTDYREKEQKVIIDFKEGKQFLSDVAIYLLSSDQITKDDKFMIIQRVDAWRKKNNWKE